MALTKKDEQRIAEIVAGIVGGNGNEPEDSEGVEEVGDIVVLKGDVAKDFLAAMNGDNSDDPDDGNSPPATESKESNRWSGFGKKYFGQE